MSMGKKSNNEPKKKGVALNDDALENVTGGKTYYAIKYVSAFDIGPCLQTHVKILDSAPGFNDNIGMRVSRAYQFDFDGDEQEAEDYFRKNKNSTAVSQVQFNRFRLHP